jgi:hypothetical protein
MIFERFKILAKSHGAIYNTYGNTWENHNYLELEKDDFDNFYYEQSSYDAPFYELIYFLDEICPNLSALHLAKILMLRVVLEQHEKNRTIYHNSISIKLLYEFLTEHNYC